VNATTAFLSDDGSTWLILDPRQKVHGGSRVNLIRLAQPAQRAPARLATTAIDDVLDAGQRIQGSVRVLELTGGSLRIQVAPIGRGGDTPEPAAPIGRGSDAPSEAPIGRGGDAIHFTVPIGRGGD